MIKRAGCSTRRVCVQTTSARPTTADPDFIDRLDAEFGLHLPRVDGFDTVEAIQAFRHGRARVFVGLGGNFARATPDTDITEAALANASLVVNISTKLNRTHLVTNGTSIILPCLGRTEIDRDHDIDHFITIEDSMGLVHASTGVLDPPSPHAKSEVTILCELGRSLFGPAHAVDWSALGADYDTIRRHVANTIDGFANFNQRVREPGGHVVMMNDADIQRLGHLPGDRVDLVSTIAGDERRVSSFQIVAYPHRPASPSPTTRRPTKCAGGTGRPAIPPKASLLAVIDASCWSHGWAVPVHTA